MSDQGPLRYRMADHAVKPGPSRRRWPIRRIVAMIVAASCWCYAAILFVLWAAAHSSAADFWPLHLFFYGPRWLVPLPAIVLVPLVAWLRSRWSALALGTALISFLGFWGFNIPWRNLTSATGESKPGLRVLTCNVQAGDLKVENLAGLVKEVNPDVLLLQECKLEDPRVVLGGDGWHTKSAGEFCLASRFPISEFEELRRPDKSYRIIAVRARLSRPDGDIPIVGVHLMTPRRGLEPIISPQSGGIGRFREIADVQRLESGMVKRWIAGAPDSIVLAGDFNLTAEHPLYRRDWTGFRDAFSWTGWGLGLTMFTRNIGLRIDHILCGPGWRPVRCFVGEDVGSAHRPVIADMIENR